MNRTLTVWVIFCLGLLSSSLSAQTPVVESFQQRPKTVNRILKARLDALLPKLMQETNIDLWLVMAREYNDDPVYRSLVPDPTFTARRTTMLVFHRSETGELKRLSVNRYPLGDLYEVAWQGGNLEQQWQGLKEVIIEIDPQKIAVNVSDHWPVADGLSHSLYQRLTKTLGKSLSRRIVSSEDLVLRWTETRLPEEIELWGRAVGVARGVIAEAFSNQVITPGVTTVSDVAWYIRERFETLGLRPWFQPYVNIQRAGLVFETDEPFFGESSGAAVIHEGDVLHTDVGICYFRLCTDTQEMGYVLRTGETDVPEGLKDALATGNRWQDLLTAQFVTGRTGNQILKNALVAANDEAIDSSVYTHPLGLFGHAPGPTIGMWDNQGDTPVRGDWPLYPMTGYAIEGNIKVPVPEYDNQLVQIKLEQSAYFDGEKVIYLAGRQTDWHIVR